MKSQSWISLPCAILHALALAGCSGGGAKATAPRGPACQLSATSLNFGSVAIGDTVTRTLTIRNSGGGTLEGTVATGCAVFVVQEPREYSLGAGESKGFTIRYAPSTTTGSTCDLATGTPCGNVQLTGNGQEPTYSIVLSKVDFGRSTPNQLGGFAILNNGSAPLTGTVASSCSNFVLIDDFAHVVPSITYTVAPGEVYNVGVSFRPSTGGPQSCVMQTGLPAYPTVTLTGFGQECNVAPTWLGLGTPWESIDKTFTISNPDSFSMSGSLAPCGPFQVLPSSYTLSPGQTQEFTARFVGYGTRLGPTSCNLDLGQATCSPVTIAAQDEVLPTALGGCAGTTLGVVDFGTLAPGEVGTKSITVRCFVERLGGGAIRCAGSLVEQSASLTFESGVFSNLAVGDSGKVVAHFSSMEPGVHHCRVMVTTNDYTGRIATYMECRATVLPAMPYRSFRAGAYR